MKTKSGIQWIKLLLVFMSTMILLSACGGEKTADSGNRNPGDLAPMFDLKDLQGKEVKLSDFKGKEVYVKYWASWCSICLAGLEDLNTLAGQKNDFQVISIVTPHYKGEQSADDFKQWFTKQDYSNVTVLLDEDGKWAQQFHVRGYPSSYYIGSDGVLVKSSPGHNENDYIVDSFKKIK